ncbi:MAG TPA: nitronate monooxygenase [Spirochaetota bacterium]|nr:nitronate monooxygenase [Spirochaetota bacterium]HPJ42700.1 nitronate monooxygenase [Spirochaetota bacterium]HRX47360.1 nitronate monooxygenase [Spirochaetota bacterium]
MSQLLDMLGSKYPVIQGPIGSINSPELVAAISEAGGYGMLALGFMNDIEEVKRLLAEVKKRTDKPFGANIMIINPLNEKIIPLLADAGMKTVTTSVGFPGKIYPLLHEHGMKGLHVLLSVKHAISAEQAGADGIVAAGAEAGGLRSTGPESSTMVLVPLIADSVKIPVVAAGGIADSRGYKAAFALGAQGVQIGTRFMAATESPIHTKWKEQIVNCDDGGTELLPVDNMMMRAIITPELRARIQSPGFDIKKEFRLANASKAWNSAEFDLVPAGAGEVSALIKDIKSVKEIIDEMVK